MVSASLTALAFGLYLAAAVCYGAFLFLRAPAAPTSAAAEASPAGAVRFGRPLLLAGILAQFAAIGAYCATTHRSPFASEYGTLSVSAWIIALVFAGVDIRLRLPAVGAISLLVTCLLLFWSVAHARGPVAETDTLSTRLVSLHVLSILASFALFAVAFGCAALYLAQNRQLKAHDGSGLFRRLPPLHTLDSVAYHLVAFALPLLTVGLAIGILRALAGDISGPPRAWLLDPHTLVSIAAWLLYVFYLAARLLVGWQGVRLQYILLFGLLVTLALYFIPSTTHRFF